jgi:hypothetical protein
MFRDGHVDDPTTVVLEHHEHKEQPKDDSRHDEEIGGHDLAGVIGEKVRRDYDGSRCCRRMYLATVD